MAKTKFSGFPLGLMHFLHELTTHNNRDWFQKNKPRYEQDLLEPALAFIESIHGPLKKLSPQFLAVPKRTGGSLMRIYRDTRFAKNKAPYKTNVGIHFRHEKGKDVHAPGFYFHIDVEQVFVGAGVWHPDSTALKKIRKSIVKNADQWKRITKAKKFNQYFELDGDSLKRPPRDFDPDHPLIEDLKRKDHFGLSRIDMDRIFKPDVVDQVMTRFRTAKPYMEFLCDALKLKI